jgi:tetratricopeptide (TPR) repeat protein
MPPPNPKPPLIQRVREALARLSGGDVIVANVGQGASDVVVGKNIVKIGTLVVPALPAMIALVALVVAVALGLWLYLVPATMPPGRFNVAVAEFAEVDTAGRAVETANSRLISRTLFNTIGGELGQLPADYQALVWHDSMTFLQKRARIGPIPGATPAERSAAACERAEKLNADMIVYGVIDSRESPAQLRMQFCVRNVTRDRDMGNLDELQKVDRLGGPLPIDLPLADVQSSVNPTLRVRTTLLAKLVVGLRYELSSNPNFQFSLRQALAVFENTLSYLDAQGGGADAENGGDLVKYFIGREHFLLFQDPATPAAERAEHLEHARMALERATELNPRYGRAWSALGTVYTQRAQGLPRPERLSTDDISRAIAAFQSAIASMQAPRDNAALAEAHLTLAMAYVLHADSSLYLTPPNADQAEQALGQAEQQVDNSSLLIEPAQNRLLGFAAMARGTIALERAQIRSRAGDGVGARVQFEQARDAYNQCIAAGKSDPGDQFLQRQIIAKTCAPSVEIVEQALRSLPQSGGVTQP